ncbi:hypothetical protein FA041_16815 [Escherichia coli]|nr:hypothetical protein [Escherichia coli]
MAEDRVSVWLTAVMHYSRMQRKARNFPSHLSGFRVTVRWQDLTRTSFQKEIDKAGSLPEQAAIVNDVKREPSGSLWR